MNAKPDEKTPWPRNKKQDHFEQREWHSDHIGPRRLASPESFFVKKNCHFYLPLSWHSCYFCVDAARYLTRFSMFSARMFAFYRGKLRRINWDCCVWVFRFKILPACSCFTYTMAGGGRRTHFFACLGHLAIHHASLSRLSTVPTPNRNSFLLETYPIFGHSARVFHIIHNTFCSPISGKIPELPLIAF